jgi:hypothetical protein
MFDWITWSVWLIGFVILIVWIVVPLREFNDMRKRMRVRVRGETPASDDSAMP